MLDCLELCELSEKEVRAIAEHEHIPEVVALELGDYLIGGPDGRLLVSHMFIDDIPASERRGDLVRAAQLKRTLRHFIEGHLAAPGQIKSLGIEVVKAATCSRSPAPRSGQTVEED